MAPKRHTWSGHTLGRAGACHVCHVPRREGARETARVVVAERRAAAARAVEDSRRRRSRVVREAISVRSRGGCEAISVRSRFDLEAAEHAVRAWLLVANTTRFLEAEAHMVMALFHLPPCVARAEAATAVAAGGTLVVTERRLELPHSHSQRRHLRLRRCAARLGARLRLRVLRALRLHLTARRAQLGTHAVQLWHWCKRTRPRKRAQRRACQCGRAARRRQRQWWWWRWQWRGSAVRVAAGQWWRCPRGRPRVVFAPARVCRHRLVDLEEAKHLLRHRRLVVVVDRYHAVGIGPWQLRRFASRRRVGLGGRRRWRESWVGSQRR